MTQNILPILADEDDGEVLFNALNGFVPAYATGQAGTSVPGGVGKGFVYTKLDGDGNILGAYFADGLGGESPVSPAHVLWGITDAGEARSALGLTRFESAEQSIVAGSTVTVADGLGAEPAFVTYCIVCKTAELGFPVGARIVPTMDSVTVGNNRVSTVRFDATNLYFSFSEYANSFLAADSTGTAVALTNTRWRLILKAGL